MNDLTNAHKIQNLEESIKCHKQIEIPVRHIFAGGIYAREMSAPKDSVFTGKIHKTQHIAMLVSGTMAISDGENSAVYEGPYTFVSEPGVKRAGVALTDCIFTTFHPVGDMKDVGEIEKLLVCDSINEYEDFLEYENMRGLK